jgi:DNA modification methylase
MFVTMNISIENIGSAKDNANSAIHNWYKFTAGFSYKLVDLIIDEMGENPSAIFEPFAGCGTTLVAAQKRKIISIGNESQQLMCDIINAKLNWDIDHNSCKNYIEIINDYVSENILSDDVLIESHELLKSLYDKETLKTLYLIRDAIRLINNEKYELFLNLALSQTLHKSALHPIAVPYIVRSKNIVNSGDAWRKFSSIVNQMLVDLDSMPHHQRYAEVYKADSRKTNLSIKENSCDLCITSPPYLNNLDYGEVSKVHTHFFELTKDWHDITELVRKELVTGATTHYRDCDFDLDEFRNSEFALCNKGLMKELEPRYMYLQKYSSKRQGKKSFHILMMHYFEDMYQVLKEMRRVLRPDSRAYLILGDSAPYGAYIPTTQFLGEIATSVGFSEYRIDKIRSRGHKWKIKTRHNVELSENILQLS